MSEKLELSFESTEAGVIFFNIMIPPRKGIALRDEELFSASETKNLTPVYEDDSFFNRVVNFLSRCHNRFGAYNFTDRNGYLRINTLDNPNFVLIDVKDKFSVQLNNILCSSENLSFGKTDLDLVSDELDFIKLKGCGQVLCSSEDPIYRVNIHKSLCIGKVLLPLSSILGFDKGVRVEVTPLNDKGDESACAFSGSGFVYFSGRFEKPILGLKLPQNSEILSKGAING